MDLIEKENTKLRGVLPKQFARPQLDKMVLGELIDLINNIQLGNHAARMKDMLGVVYEYFLGQFPWQKDERAGSSIRPDPWFNFWLKCFSPITERSMIPVAVAVGCS